MPRPRKWRKVCEEPDNIRFGPLNILQEDEKYLVMTVDEYEVIRLIDLLEMTQEECALQMKVSRTTVQAIYNEARKKLAKVLINQIELRIEGGDYMLCEGRKTTCNRTTCCSERSNEK